MVYNSGDKSHALKCSNNTTSWWWSNVWNKTCEHWSAWNESCKKIFGINFSLATVEEERRRKEDEKEEEYDDEEEDDDEEEEER